MTKYYRVRTPEQWDWLMKRIESDNRKARFYSPLVPPCRPTKLEIDPENFKKDVLVGVNGNGVEWDTFNYFVKEENVTDFIEVSDLMECEKMENEDCVTIKDEDLEKVRWETNYGHASFINHDENGEKYVHEQYLPANLIIPESLVQQKVKTTKAEKKEFDKLKDEMSLDRHDLDDLLTRIKDSEDFPLLYHRLYVADGDGVESQLEFARAWADPSLIEVIPEKKWNVKVPISCDDAYYNKVINDCKDAVMVKNNVDKRSLQINNNFKFTAEEIKYHHLDNDLFEKVEVIDNGTK